MTATSCWNTSRGDRTPVELFLVPDGKSLRPVRPPRIAKAPQIHSFSLKRLPPTDTLSTFCYGTSSPSHSQVSSCARCLLDCGQPHVVLDSAPSVVRSRSNCSKPGGHRPSSW